MMSDTAIRPADELVIAPEDMASLKHIYEPWCWMPGRGAPIGAKARCGHVKTTPSDPRPCDTVPPGERCVVCYEVEGRTR